MQLGPLVCVLDIDKFLGNLDHSSALLLLVELLKDRTVSYAGLTYPLISYQDNLIVEIWRLNLVRLLSSLHLILILFLLI